MSYRTIPPQTQNGFLTLLATGSLIPIHKRWRIVFGADAWLGRGREQTLDSNEQSRVTERGVIAHSLAELLE